MLVTGLTSTACSACFLTVSRTTCSGMLPFRVGWALRHQLLIKKSPHNILVHGPVWWRKLSALLSSDHNLCEVDKEIIITPFISKHVSRPMLHSTSTITRIIYLKSQQDYQYYCTDVIHEENHQGPVKQRKVPQTSELPGKGPNLVFLLFPSITGTPTKWSYSSTQWKFYQLPLSIVIEKRKA